MIIQTCKLNNFRSHSDYILKCNDVTSLILGENGCGKTSVLEAIYIATQGKSFRAVDREIIKRGEDFYRIELSYSNGEKTVVIFDGEKKKFLVGDKSFLRLPRKYKYPVVLFLPDDLSLVDSSPSHKRDYFDRTFVQFSEKYSNALSKYNKALKQRNELLKKEFLKKDELFSWDILMVKYGFEIMKFRKEMINEVNKRITEVYRTIADNNDEVFIKYKTQEIENGNKYLNELEKSFEKDRILRHTSFGVHKDDYEFLFNNVAADGSASRGEVRSIVLALKFIEANLITEKLQKRPLVLLDDVFSELDETRQKCLVKNFKENQVIITSVDVSYF